jgi:hypothetical protein
MGDDGFGRLGKAKRSQVQRPVRVDLRVEVDLTWGHGNLHRIADPTRGKRETRGLPSLDGGTAQGEQRIKFVM